MQWSGHSRVVCSSASLSGFLIVIEEMKGLLCGGGWFEAKEIWSGGCQSFVATLRGKGSVRRVLIIGAMSLPPCTAREPFWVWVLVERCELVYMKTNWWTEVLLEVHYD